MYRYIRDRKLQERLDKDLGDGECTRRWLRRWIQMYESRRCWPRRKDEKIQGRR